MMGNCDCGVVGIYDPFSMWGDLPSHGTSQWFIVCKGKLLGHWWVILVQSESERRCRHTLSQLRRGAAPT